VARWGLDLAWGRVSVRLSRHKRRAAGDRTGLARPMRTVSVEPLHGTTEWPAHGLPQPLQVDRA